MIYLDHGATSFPKPRAVTEAVGEAMSCCANPGRGSHAAARAGAEVLYECREAAGELFRIEPEQVALTMNCTHGLNIAIRSLVRPKMKVAAFRPGGYPPGLPGGPGRGGGGGGLHPCVQCLRLYPAPGEDR